MYRHLFFLFSLLFFSNASPAVATTNATVYTTLTEFGLPPGLLPNSVTRYSLTESGEFEVELEKPCYIHFDYLVYYDRKITGILKYGSISDLKGIEVRKLFVWLDVDEIKVDLPPSDFIYFTVGWINKKLDVEQFMSVKGCGDNGIDGVWSDLIKV
ncbi:hypothetical protein GIB67_016909 [Kingdonia uniflora]|uniref:Uncharacterized protein n=1 Tax=Kingdonia uniflora TaxID=39325 RepID=A0A7J7M3B9_9MAGN|nr:hypothetical protein GIB67_016909 [Kingdonia uniflora]